MNLCPEKFGVWCLNAMRGWGGAINSRWNLGVEGWGRREGCALLCGPRECYKLFTHPQSSFERDLVCACPHSRASSHHVGNTGPLNPPCVLFTLVCSDSLPAGAVCYSSPKLAYMCMLLDFGVCKTRLWLYYTFLPLCLMTGGSWHSVLHHEIQVGHGKHVGERFGILHLFLNQYNWYWLIIHFMQVKKATLQTTADTTQMRSPRPQKPVSKQTEGERRYCLRNFARVKSSFYTEVTSFYADVYAMHKWWLFRRSYAKYAVLLSSGFPLKQLITFCSL